MSEFQHFEAVPVEERLRWVTARESRALLVRLSDAGFDSIMASIPDRERAEGLEVAPPFYIDDNRTAAEIYTHAPSNSHGDFQKFIVFAYRGGCRLLYRKFDSEHLLVQLVCPTREEGASDE